MPAFNNLDWDRIDVTAIVAHSGLAIIPERRHSACREWLVHQGYQIDTFDCRPGLAVAIPELGRRLRWEKRFGYALTPDSRNLDALRDGFTFDCSEGGRVFEIVQADLAWEEDRRWFCGLLSIAQEQCRYRLALGQRFFTLLVVTELSPLFGAPIEQAQIPGPCTSSFR
jgi:hypothetical protein